MMLLLVLFCVLVPISYQQCLTPKDDVRKVSDQAFHSLLYSELQFSTDLARVVTRLQPNQNVFFSPSSIYRALLMVYFLSANQTEANLRKTLHLDAKLDKLDYLGAYYLGNYYQKLRSIKGEGCQMNLANRMYIDKDIDVQHCINILFSDEIQPANFKENGDKVRRKINGWVASQTNNVIKDFLSEDAVSKNTELVLLNAAYFKGFWKSEFDKESTHIGPFYLSNGTKVTTTMMAQESKLKLRRDDKLGAEVLELPYLGEEVSMFIVLPLEHKPSTLQDMLQKIDGASVLNLIKSIVADNTTYHLSVTMPKFTMEAGLQLVPILNTMGVGDLFQDKADLSTLTTSRALSFSDAIHKAKIKVDEKGTEAAAATGFITARMGPPYIMINRPFVYILYDKVTNKILFLGVFSSPP